jgi:AcrR family transcriptional regulator
VSIGLKKVPRAVRERQMLSVATAVFAERGFHAASMGEIAERAGVSKPMVYAYFESKEGLWRSCVSGARKRLFDSIDDAVDTTAPPEVQLWLGVEAFFAFVEEQRDSWALLDEAQAGPFVAEVVDVRRESVAVLLVNFAWLGFGDLVRGARWRPPGRE